MQHGIYIYIMASYIAIISIHVSTGIIVIIVIIIFNYF